MPFRDAWLMVGALLILLGFGTSQPVISGVGLAIVAIGASARFWSRHVFDRVTVGVNLAETRAFVEEPVNLNVTLENRKVLPLPWFTLRLAVSDGLRVDGEALASQVVPGLSWIHRRGAIGWYERQQWDFTLQAPARGFHQVGPATLRSADIFGLLPQSTEIGPTRRLTIYPATVPLGQFGVPADRPLGTFKGRNRLFEDPVRLAGLREYRPGDPLKRIDWKATARRGDLMSRVYDPSAEPQVYLLVNIDTLEHSWEGYLKDNLERTVSVAASVAVWAGERRYAVGLLANGSFPGADRPIRLPPSRARGQLSRVLEALAVIQPLTMGDLAGTVRDESGRIPAGSTIVLVAALIPEQLAGAILRLRDERNHVMVFATSDRVDTTLLTGVPVYHAGQGFSAAAVRP